MNREQRLRGRITLLTWFFILGLVISGATAIPIRWEVDKLIAWLDPHGASVQPLAQQPFFVRWLLEVQAALPDERGKGGLLFYGTDWLAFGHFVIAIVFVGALRDPVRNRWLFDFGLIACGLVIPYAIIFGELRGIPFWWRLIDGSFGVVGFVPLWFCQKWTRELEHATKAGK
jgi:hypothetical protein